ncbi:hypothetical protein FKR81_41685 [Lentzea tibetensis]|uniref:Uncharacterized protein n=1 Tax=Lentzea tibetensis TaxID=2591470 RepID=A0A563EFJ8_9PSEU|nr:hypothetical protein [Lentzea tibetensis]TWP44042.1 hypothetical protein FKR81_41685 [Lentzea tibetensis]
MRIDPTLQMVCTRYRERLGWPVVADPARNSARVFIGDLISALVVPADEARTVLSRALAADVRCAVFSDAIGSRWTFLVRPSYAPLCDHQVVRRGEHVALPSLPGVVLATGLRWVVEPQPLDALSDLGALTTAAAPLVAADR